MQAGSSILWSQGGRNGCSRVHIPIQASCPGPSPQPVTPPLTPVDPLEKEKCSEVSNRAASQGPGSPQTDKTQMLTPRCLPLIVPGEPAQVLSFTLALPFFTSQHWLLLNSSVGKERPCPTFSAPPLPHGQAQSLESTLSFTPLPKTHPHKASVCGANPTEGGVTEGLMSPCGSVNTFQLLRFPVSSPQTCLPL